MRVGERLVYDTSEPSVSVLGPTTIGTQSVTPRQRSLVAALALAGNCGADIEELADAVWAGRPPGSSRSSLQNQMTRLRRTHGDRLIVCEHARYRLDRPTDVEHFERAVADARSREPDPTSTESLAAALTLWRGTPYFDLTDCHAADVERARLTQKRADAVELLAIGRITLGDYEQCIAELRAEVEGDPFRDRAWELLFVALQRAGRTGEALVAHQDFVERLRLELGSEPSQRLLDVGRALSRSLPLDFGDATDSAAPVLAPQPAVCRHDRTRRRCQAGRSRRSPHTR